MSTVEERLVEAETKLAYQDDTVLKLNDIVSQQQAQIDRLEASLRALHKRLQDLSESASNIESGHQKPPHY